MQPELKNLFFRLFLTFLLSVGLLLPMLGLLELMPCAAASLGVAASLSVLLEICGLNRKTRIISALLLTGAFLFYVLSGGISELRDVLLAITLHLSGIQGALPLISLKAALVLTLFTSFFSFGATRRMTGCIPAVLVSFAAMMLIWIGNRPSLLLFLLPAILASFLLILNRQGETNPARTLPWAVGIVLIAFLLTPSKGIEIPALREKADELRQAVLDRFFFTEPRDVFSLSAEGFYPEGSGQLGGPVAPNPHPVMQVSAPRTVYLKGVSLNEYNGRAWHNTLGGRRYLWESASSGARRRILFDQNLPGTLFQSSITEERDVSVRMISSGVSTLFVPQRIREFRSGGELIPYFSDASELFATRNLKEGDTWSVSAPLFIAGDPGIGTLIDAAESAEDPQWNQIQEIYTRLPSHLEEPVWQLAIDLTAGERSHYNQAYALQSYLSRNYRYTLTPPEQPSNLDFVTNFLFNTHQGYCTYFASAMTVLCRMVGLPARYIEGYLAEPNENGEVIVTGLNAHSWTEVYFKGFGWLTFDATPHSAQSAGNGGDDTASSSSGKPTPVPGREEPTPTPEKEKPTPPEEQTADLPEEASPDSTPTPSPTPVPEEASESETADPDDPSDEGSDTGESRRNRSAAPFLWILLLLLLIALLILRWRHTSPALREKKAADENEKFEVWVDEIASRLASRGIERKTGETPLSWTRRLDAAGALPVKLSPIGECVSLLRYSQAETLPEDTVLARETALSLRKNQTVPVRLRYFVNRLKFRRSHHDSGKRR